MNIKIIGTGAIWTKYNSASYLIDESILIDIPNGTCKNIIRFGMDLNKIDKVLITHFHGDHYFDIPFYYLFKSKVKSDLCVYCDKIGKRKIEKLFKLAFPNTVKKVHKAININYNHNKYFEIDNYKVTRILVDHGSMKPAYGYIFNNGIHKVGFTGDTNLNDNVKEMANICDYLFCDCSLIKGDSKHMGIDNIEYLANTYKNCKFVVSHLRDDTRDAISLNNYINIIIPNDGDEFNLE